MVLKVRVKWVLKGSEVVLEKENVDVLFVFLKVIGKMRGLKEFSNFFFEEEFEVMIKVLK